MFWKTTLFSFFLFFCTNVWSQEFRVIDDKKKTSFDFQLINNLIFIPVEINGVSLTFLLDTGVNETILFSIGEEDLQLKNVEKMRFTGLGENLQIEGLKSENNQLNISGVIEDPAHTIYIILDQDFNFSSHVGIPVHGIIGFQFFKNFPVEINYINKKITIHNNPDIFNKRKRKFDETSISIVQNKPYVMADVEMINEKKPSNLLIDIGNSDPLWLFPTLIKDFVYNRPNIDDFLGRGFNGDIHGKRSRIHALYIDEFEFKTPITSMPDEYSIQNLKLTNDRKGSVGSEIMRRFTVIFDYQNEKMFLKKNRNYSDPFQFNMSGLDFKHDGEKWEPKYVKVDVPQAKSNENSSVNKISVKMDFQYELMLLPIFSVAGCRKDSPAYEAGIRKDDVLESINGKKTSQMTLEELNLLMKSEEGKFFRFEIMRNGKRHEFSFYLEDPIPYQEK